MPQSKKKATKKKATRSSKASWSEGERRLDRLAAKAGVKPIGDIADLPHLSPEDGEEFMEAIRQIRSMDRRAREEKAKRSRAPKRA